MTATLLEPGRYMCVRTSGFIPWVIREATLAEVDHVVIVVGGGMVVEAEPPRVITSPLAKYHGAYAVANTAEPMTVMQRRAVEARALELVGTAYNWAAIGTDGCEILGWHWRWLLKLAAADHELDCSQLAAACGQAAGLGWLCGRTEICQVTPADLSRRPGVRPVVWGNT